MINDTVGRASLLPRLSTSQNRVYPCTGYRSAYYTVPLRLYQRTTASILPARSSDLSFSFHRAAWSLHLRLRFLKLGPGIDHGGIQNGNFRLGRTCLVWVTTIHPSFLNVSIGCFLDVSCSEFKQKSRLNKSTCLSRKNIFRDIRLTLESYFLD